MSKFAWSHTSKTLFDTCPKKYEAEKVTKVIKFQETPATKWGNEVHKWLENRVKLGTPLPDAIKQYEPLAAKICAMKGQILCEQQMTLTAEGVPCDWFGKGAWLRGAADVLVLNGESAYVLDYKTGKRKAETDQLALMALLVFYHYPEVKRCKTMFLWLKSNETDQDTFYREQIEQL